ncbi:helix-turn-helix transcriptional regulator, partial [Klebsiella pneumoniae]
PLNIALMDRCPLTLEGLASFLKTLPTQVKVVVKETSVRAVVDSVVYQQADVLITELDGDDETVAQGREALLALCTQLPELRVIAYTRCRNAEELGRLLPQPNV